MTAWKVVVLLVSLLTISANAADDGKAATVQNVAFNFASPKSKLEIVFDKEIAFEKSVSEADKQVIIDIPNAKIGKKWARRIDASQFKSNVAMISPYQSENRVRITLQLKDNGGIEISQDGKTITAMIDNKQLPEKAAEVSTDLNDTEKQASSPDGAKEEAPVADTVAPSAAAANSGDSLDAFIKSQETKTYSGKHIFLQVQDTELSEVFRAISEASEFNILLADNIKGKIMLNLTDVPWDQALDIILHSYRLAAERQGNVLRITTLAALTAERESEAAAQKAVSTAEPVVTKIFPISYAKVDDLRGIIRDFMSKDPAGAGGGFAGPGGNANAGLRGSIQIDARTNSLIIRDTPTAIETIKRIVKELDTATPQILIEGKFVEVSEGTSDSISGRLFLTSREADPATGTFGNFTNANNNFGSTFNTNAPEAFSPASFPGSSGAGFGFAPKAALLPGLSEIGAFISILQSESTARIISSPRIVTQNKESATITQGSNIFLNGQGGVANAITLTLNLNVTPQVTNDGSVLMKLSFSQDTLGTGPPGSIATNTKSVNTNVIVESGGTVVIGGVYTSTNSISEAGIPLLRNLPIIGPFFGTKVRADAKNELFIFITPRVLNEKEAGIKG